MTIRINRLRLKAERRGRGWSQEHLAAASGVSVRTLQRLERGGTATHASLMAVAAALDLPVRTLAAPDTPVRRVTPLTILPDIGPSLARYRRLGFTSMETDDPGCVGLRAGSTHLILCTTAFMARDFQTANVAPLAGRTIPYVWVESLEAATEAFAGTVKVVVERAAMREALVGDGGHWAILAETTA